MNDDEFEKAMDLTVKELIDDMITQGYEYQTIRDYRAGTPFMIIATTGDSALALNSTMLRITSPSGGD